MLSGLRLPLLAVAALRRLLCTHHQYPSPRTPTPATPPMLAPAATPAADVCLRCGVAAEGNGTARSVRDWTRIVLREKWGHYFSVGCLAFKALSMGSNSPSICTEGRDIVWTCASLSDSMHFESDLVFLVPG